MQIFAGSLNLYRVVILVRILANCISSLLNLSRSSSYLSPDTCKLHPQLPNKIALPYHSKPFTPNPTVHPHPCHTAHARLTHATHQRCIVLVLPPCACLCCILSLVRWFNHVAELGPVVSVCVVMTCSKLTLPCRCGSPTLMREVRKAGRVGNVCKKMERMSSCMARERKEYNTEEEHKQVGRK